MARVAVRMALHDGQKTWGAILGIAFAYLLIGQNICTTDHYLSQATAYIDNAGAELWITAPATKAVFSGAPSIPTSALHQARVVPGVEWAEPIVVGQSWARLPGGGAHGMILFGVSTPSLHGGPFNLVVGDARTLLRPNAIIIDDVEREKLGGVNVGDVVEVNGTRTRVEGLTWGAMSMNGPYAFTEFDFARSLLDIDSDRVTFVLVHVSPGVSVDRVRRALVGRVSSVAVLTTEEFRASTNHFILFDAGVIGVLGMGLFIGFTVGFAIVTLSMISSVQQNIREFGTMKAIGATNADLRRILLLQALIFAVIGSFIGAAILCQVAWLIRSAQLNMIVQPAMLLTLWPLVTSIAVGAALFAIRRIARLEPASVFR